MYKNRLTTALAAMLAAMFFSCTGTGTPGESPEAEFCAAAHDSVTVSPITDSAETETARTEAETVSTETVSTETVFTENEATEPVTAESATTELPAEIPEETAAPQNTETIISIPKLRGMTRTEAEQILCDAALTFTVTEEYSRTANAGIVLSVRFYGEVGADAYSVKPSHPVELVVSLGVRPIVNVTALDEKRVYLTFDDGPCAGTDKVLEILSEYDVKATFFTLGMYTAVYPERTKAISDGGHLLACHSYSHDYNNLYQSAETVLDEIESWKKTVEKATGAAPETVVFRFPGGSTTYYMDDNRFEEIFWAVTDAGYRVFDWTFADNDRYPGGKTESQTMEEYLMAATVSSLDNCEAAPAWPKIMLLHDTSDETVAVLPWIIEYLRGEGYSFGTLDELEGYWIFER